MPFFASLEASLAPRTAVFSVYLKVCSVPSAALITNVFDALSTLDTVPATACVTSSAAIACPANMARPSSTAQPIRIAFFMLSSPLFLGIQNQQLIIDAEDSRH